MMTKKHSRLQVNTGLLMILPVIAVLLFLIPGCSQNDKPAEAGMEVAPPPPPPPPPPVGDIDPTNGPFEQVDKMPVFNGGDDALIKFIADNTIYPEAAKTNGIQGKVIVGFVVENDGSIDRVKVVKGVDPDLDKEAVRVVSTVPGFEKPGIKDGKAVAVRYQIPINFALK
ncbi:MAG: hypothetical protein A2V46_02825 [Bacteroidetes bacterium RBG_19FT_COMBO_42_7]|nr:MAG: hypothetical protein A2V46_02825 [Bacteroidetes bacterium RBG_19FT_COMBO_42_7]